MSFHIVYLTIIIFESLSATNTVNNMNLKNDNNSKEKKAHYGDEKRVPNIYV